MVRSSFEGEKIQECRPEQLALIKDNILTVATNSNLEHLTVDRARLAKEAMDYERARTRLANVENNYVTRIAALESKLKIAKRATEYERAQIDVIKSKVSMGTFSGWADETGHSMTIETRGLRSPQV